MRISNQSPEGLQRNYTYNESGVVKIDISELKNNKIELVSYTGFKFYDDMTGKYHLYKR